MKNYERAELQVILFEANDILTNGSFTSSQLDGFSTTEVNSLDENYIALK